MAPVVRRSAVGLVAPARQYLLGSVARGPLPADRSLGWVSGPSSAGGVGGFVSVNRRPNLSVFDGVMVSPEGADSLVGRFRPRGASAIPAEDLRGLWPFVAPRVSSCAHFAFLFSKGHHRHGLYPSDDIIVNGNRSSERSRFRRPTIGRAISPLIFIIFAIMRFMSRFPPSISPKALRPPK